MIYPSIQDLHIELTDKCQASCPMCARNYNGGPERSFVSQHEITLKQFKQWFPSEWLEQLTNFYACGNYGDPILAQDCLEIFEYVRQINSTTRLSIHTNGSARTTEWWSHLAKILGSNHDVAFGIDGFSDSHVLYRRGTVWDKIMENAHAFISAGGRAYVDSLIFAHNEHQALDFEKDMLSRGFMRVNFKSTSRFYDMEEFPVHDKNNNVEYTLKPATTERFKKEVIIPIEQIAKNLSIWKRRLADAEVDPKCVNDRSVYVDSRGNVFPCCWVGSDIIEEFLVEKYTIQKLRNMSVSDTKKRFTNIKNLTNSSIRDINFDDIDKHWQGADKAWSCVKNCAN